MTMKMKMKTKTRISQQALQLMARRRQASKAAHAMLVQQLDRAQRLANTGSWVWDIVSNDLVWSDQLFRIFGLSQDVFAPTSPGFLERVHPDERALVAQRIQRAIEGAEAYALDYRIILPDGSVRIIHEQGQVDYDPSGQALRMLGAALDITRIIRQEELGQAGAPTPILALTANVMTDQRASYRQAGMDGVVAKPIDAAKLLTALEAALTPERPPVTSACGSSAGAAVSLSPRVFAGCCHLWMAPALQG